MDQYERLEGEIAAVLKDYVAAKKQFTAVDVGNELKAKGINARQRDVSPIVRQQFESGDVFTNTGFTRTMVPVKGGNYEAFLYTHIDCDPSQYTTTNLDTLPFDPNKPMFSDSIDDVVSGANTQTSATQTTGQGTYVASRRSKVMHSPNCMYAGRIKQDNLVTLDAATQQNYRLCRLE